MEKNLEKTLEELLNRASAENDSGTPDFILAKYLITALNAFNTAIKARDDWRSEHANDLFAR